MLLTGSPSNVEATRYEATALETDLLDPRRDALTMALVPAATLGRKAEVPADRLLLPLHLNSS